MKEFVRKKWHILLYFLFLFLIFVGVLCHRSEDESFQIKEGIPFEQQWQYDFLEGTTGQCELPCDLPKTKSNTLILTNTLPVLRADTSFFFRVRHTAVRIYIGDKLMLDTISGHEEDLDWSNLLGIYYQEIPVTVEDSGKPVRIESMCSTNHYLSSPGSVYLGDRGSLFLQIIKNKYRTVLCVLVLLLLGVSMFVLWIISMHIFQSLMDEMLYLSLFALAISLWLITETECLQFIMKDTGAAGLFAYEILMLLPIPLALFFSCCIEREVVRRASYIAVIIPLGVFVFNNTMHFFRIIHLADSLLLTQFILAVETFLVSFVQISEIRYKRKQENRNGAKLWKIPLIGIVILGPAALIEIMKYAFVPTKYPNDGVMISLGVIFYILALAIDSMMRVAYSSERFKRETENKSQFLADMSHEIRTPLNAILGFDEAILRISDDEKVRKYAMNIQEAGDNLKGIINSILDITKIESGKLEIYEVEYSMLQLLDHLTSMFESLTKKKGLTLYTDIDERLPEVLIGDENHILQVLTNIMNNAVKYTPSGSVTFTVKVMEMPENLPLCKIYFSVKDTGIGIKEEDRKRLFEKFERLDREKNYSTEGTGLGMSIVVQLLQAMNSEIQLDSVYGEGSNFYFELTQSVVNRSEIGSFIERRKQMALENSHGVDFIAPDAKILIVDDVQMNLDAAYALLEDTKMQIDTAQSGMEAIEKIKKEDYDLVLMDHMMPGMDGIVATEKIRDLASETGDPKYAELPILALTANAMVGMKETFLQAGMQGFISKPIDINALNAEVKRWLPKNLISYVEVKEEVKEDDTVWEIGIPCIDIEMAKQFNPTFALFERNLKNYYENYENVSQRLMEMKEQKDVENYTITVHGLKSTSRMIGLQELSDKALDLEEHCQEGETDYVWKENDNLLQLYASCVEQIGVYYGASKKQADNANAMDEAAYEQLIDRIKQAADTFDMGAFMELEIEFDGLVVPAEKEEEFKKIKQLVVNASFGEVSELLK